MKTKYLKWILILASLLILVVFAFVFSLASGEMSIPFNKIPEIFNSKSGIEYTILSQIRLPRTIMAFAVGGALSLTGAILQGIYRNPLVEPYTLGISGGAAFAVALVIVLSLHITIGAYVLPLAGFIGSISTIFAVYFLSIRKGVTNINRMLLIGVMISFVASSAMMFLMSITTSENLHGIVFWMMGSLDEPNEMLINIVLYSSIAGLFIAYFFARPLNALRLGQDKAQHLGINTSATIRILFVVASLLTGICVAVAGIIGFVGLVIPHLIRNIVGADYRILLVGSFLGGSIFLIFCDIIARTIIMPNELPIGVITGMVGGVIFIIVLARTRLKLN
ncbi:MAG TPA: iron ABC transporter permease [Prolixibacteraceae bacterium]|nr:iron ABC transporter permease [Prolixibacteraceae bacterium]